MDYKKKYEEALERARKLYHAAKVLEYEQDIKDYEEIFPELTESKDEKIRKEIIAFIKKRDRSGCDYDYNLWLDWLEKQGEPIDKGEISDGYHTFNELYYYRMLYNAAFFNLLPKEWVHKSKRHYDGEECFGGGWFIVMANLPTGQISNHYELKDWDLFQIPEKEVADEWDGHTPQEAAERLHEYLLEKQGQVKESSTLQHEGTHEDVSCKEKGNSLTRKPEFKVGNWVVYNYSNTVSPISEIIQIDGGIVEFKDTNGSRFQTEIDELNCNYHLWNITDAKNDDVLVSNNSIFIFNREYAAGKPEAYCGIINGEFIDNAEGCWTNEKCYPATKEQRDLLFAKMREAGYKWDENKKELRKINQNIAWSEEDEKFLNQAIEEVDYALNDKDMFYSGTSPIIDWLKTIKQRLGG